MTILEIRGVERRFDGAGGGTLALQSTDLDVAENDFVTILGPSGCGKSTLLRIVAGLDHPTAGEVQLDGRRIDGPGADRGMVFQSYTTCASACASVACRARSNSRSRTVSSPRWA